MTVEPDFRPVLNAYPASCQPQRVEFLGSAGGFSGALFWRLTTTQGLLCLRRWPQEHPTEERLQFMQAVLWHVHQEGFRQAPLPLETIQHAGFVRHAGHLWELSPWMPGKADYHQAPSPAKLSAALEALARFHLAAASFPLPDGERAPSPGMQERLAQLQSLADRSLTLRVELPDSESRATGSDLLRLEQAISPPIWPELAARWPRLRALFLSSAPKVQELLTRAAAVTVPLQPCLRDIWHDHVLFEGDRVTALVDFGALRTESVAADVARLLGSLVADDLAAWRQGRAAYETVRRLSEDEDLLVAAFDQSSVLMSGLSWMRWVFLDRRQFSDPAAILARVDANLARLQRLAS